MTGACTNPIYYQGLSINDSVWKYKQEVIHTFLKISLLRLSVGIYIARGWVVPLGGPNVMQLHCIESC